MGWADGLLGSGTLAYAVGAGKAVISTPYACARELLADGTYRRRAATHGEPPVRSQVALQLLAREASREKKSDTRPKLVPVVRRRPDTDPAPGSGRTRTRR